MKEIKCDVIRDLLPNYNDKISSEATNELVEEHLKYCPDCTQVLENMNKEIDVEPLQNQEEIDYLKGYRKKKIKNIVFAIVLTMDIILAIFILGLNVYIKYLEYITEAEFYVNVDEIEVETVIYKVDESGKERMRILIYHPEYYLSQSTLRSNNGTNYLEIVGKKKAVQNIPGGSGYGVGIGISDGTNKIYLKDTRGNIKEIWDQDKTPLNLGGPGGATTAIVEYGQR